MTVKNWIELMSNLLMLEQVAEQQRITGKVVAALNWNVRMQEVLERTAAYDMSLMNEEQNAAYTERLQMNRMMLDMKKAALCGNTVTAT
ncbi:hypothetical protein DFP93_106160 [Aneurinibacillus soli]|uniref:Uncharacterized protein n=1 Tax=Aneurinibacillus soli TaxID=1500254 RepID=A0A0U5B1D1_9BACL|nr:hypothetical protein [Aneurinibacillus soli]PYE61966.1 hypothetical protein DFP93_106160 [Aneurinibacillus soli]BAU29781.1 hypothetical protein CB4_04018 [Aneurinibacillus soli]